MVRALPKEDRSEFGASASIERPRLIERLAGSTKYPIALLIAPAGYGKSVILRQYLSSLVEPSVRFAVRAEHAALLGFLRGLTEALREEAPHAITALAGAYERNASSPNRAGDLARWLDAHLESFHGVVAIDDLHVADGDPEVARFVTFLIEQTKTRIRWILASRSTAGLPVGTWLAYRDADLPVDEHDLRFTVDEARDGAHSLGLAIRDEELADLLGLTEGWPAAMSFALRTSTRSSELRNVSALTRDMIYRLLAEQVYAALDDDERSLLEVAVALPVIEVSVLERAGFDRALTIIERLRERTAFIYEESPGIYQCHDLFREFLRHEAALGGKRSQQLVHERAAGALEESSDVEHAIASYVAASALADVLRLLERHGFDLLERAHGDVVARAIEALDEKTRRENPSVLALQGALQAVAGKFARAESLLRRALARSGNDRDLTATVSLRLASLIGNQGRDVLPVLGPVATDRAQGAKYQAEALSLIAARQAIVMELFSPDATIANIEKLIPEIDSEAALTRVLHHLGIVNRHIGRISAASKWLTQASELATDLHLYSVASRTYAVLSNLSLHEKDDVELQRYYAESAAWAATKAGDAFALQTALLQMLSARMRSGDVEGSLEIERRLTTLHADPSIARYVTLFRALRFAWLRHFGEARELLSACWSELPLGADRACSGAQYALFLALDGHREASIKKIQDLFTMLGRLRVSGRFDIRSITICQVLCALAECANGRRTHAERILGRLTDGDLIEKATIDVAKGILRGLRSRSTADWAEVEKLTESLANFNYRDIARLLAAASGELRDHESATKTSIVLTISERQVLRLLADGLVPKEIAAETGRSVHTVRVHIANAIQKLECNGRAAAIRSARRLGLI